MTTSRPVYESMRDWQIERKRAEIAAKQDGIGDGLRRERTKYVAWLDEQRPDWIADLSKEKKDG